MVLFRDAQAAQGRADIEGCVGSIARRNRCRLTNDGKAVEVDVLAHIVNRDIETRGVSQVENIEGVLSGRNAR